MRGVRIEQFMSHDELVEAMSEAHVVVCHGGVGSALMALSAGRSPILVPRRSDLSEHVDDHQRQITDWLDDAGLAIGCDANAITTSTLKAAAVRRIVRADTPPSLKLRNTHRARRVDG
jgi:UDP-N-acetylglucosamine transferase subunit ALG13